ncbi:Acetoin:2,6-dichlorophenolindophenol oxidoreductase subunit alpha [Mycobacterium basiliense]|uniref:Acetoin:2,6-dichlorophenolindophenol oxidoreductase subunit alpha n=1 Tax=Mycobacterium basiliense TaxID=2094119 RepID=A0A447GJB4_9MYCO|nr:thiamine pyrophosphate-dependent enzyme [Mycobacterium basiliense]VDM90592.1 Acetoin:2,6-dichlorophenolindophenol oxidoreductase subunit alpha [Mycobacterium basiliense]
MTGSGARSAERLVDRLELYRRMWVLRLLDMALEQLRAEGLISRPVESALGREAVGIGATAALRAGDIVISARRAHVSHVGVGRPLGSMIAELMAGPATKSGADDDDRRPDTPAEGRLTAPRVGEHSPLLAIGHAYTQWLDASGRVTLCVAEDVDLNSGAINEAANMAMLWQLPVVILVESVRRATTVGADGQECDARLYPTAVCKGLPSETVDGDDVEAVRDCVARAVERARAGGGPKLVRASIARNAEFVMTDRGDIGEHPATEGFPDPLISASRRLIADGVDREQLDNVEQTARQLIADAVALARSGPRPADGGFGHTVTKADGQTGSRR